MPHTTRSMRLKAGIKLTKHQIKEGCSVRKCMCCANEFVSDGKHNRLCYVCKHSPYASGISDISANSGDGRVRHR